MPAGKRGLTPFDPLKHARFKTARAYGFQFPTVLTYPIDRTYGLTTFPMDGNGPDDTVTVPGVDPTVGVGDCGPCAVPAKADMLTAVMLGLQLSQYTRTANQVIELYFEFTGGQDTGVDLGDWLLFLFKKGIIEGFLALELSEVDAALSTFPTVVGGWILPPNFDDCFNRQTVLDIGPANQPNPQEGHAMLIGEVLGMNGFTKAATWTGWITMTANARRGMLQQAFAVLTEDEATAVNFPFATLAGDLKAQGGTIDPLPMPHPAPQPAAPSSLEQAISVIEKGFNAILAELRAL